MEGVSVEAAAAQSPVPTTSAGAGEERAQVRPVPPVASLAPSVDGPAPGARTYRIVRVASVDVALPDQYPTVTLEDVEEHRARLAFRIGTAEGVALAHALAGTSAPRPLTHDLFALALERCGVDVVAVRLTGRIATTYFAELELAGPRGREVLSCRPSDGICLALRQRVAAPVLCDERLFVVPGDVAPDVPGAVAPDVPGDVVPDTPAQGPA